MIGEHVEHRIYVWGESVPDARRKAIAALRERGFTPPFPEFDVKWTGLSRPGHYDISPGLGYGDYSEQITKTQRRYSCDPLI